MFSQSFAFDQEIRLKDNDFKENLAGRWEGNWYYGSISAKERIKIIKIDGHYKCGSYTGKVQLKKIE